MHWHITKKHHFIDIISHGEGEVTVKEVLQEINKDSKDRDWGKVKGCSMPVRMLKHKKNISFNYNYKDSIIKINSPEKKNNQKIKFNSIVELDPFYLDGEIILEEKKVSFITDYILNSITNADKKLLENLNGELKLSLSNLDSKLLKNGKILLFINEGQIKTANSFFEIDKIGTIDKIR